MLQELMPDITMCRFLITKNEFLHQGFYYNLIMFINRNIQSLFFEAQRQRRCRRECAGVVASEEHCSMLDKCLNMILCHQPEVWRYGSGILLIASTTPERLIISSDAEREALCDRVFARNRHEYLRYNDANDTESFGYFVRMTFEYTEKCRAFLKDSVRKLPVGFTGVIDYLENDSMTNELQTFALQVEKVRRAGVKRYGISFENERSLIKGFTIGNILFEIENGARLDFSNVHPLRDLFDDIFPDLFEKDPVDYDEYEVTCRTCPERVVLRDSLCKECRSFFQK